MAVNEKRNSYYVFLILYEYEKYDVKKDQLIKVAFFSEGTVAISLNICTKIFS